MASRAAEGAPGRLSAVAAAGGIAFIAIAAGGVIAHSTAALQNEAGSNPATISALWDLGNMAFVFAGLASAALIWAVGLLAMRFSALPAILGPVSLVIAVYIYVVSLFGTFADTGAFSVRDGLLGQLGVYLLLAWVLAVSIALVANPVYKRARGGR